MTEAEKLLATLDVNDPKLLPIPSKDDGYIIIGEDRIITVPDALKRIAVQYDIDVEAVMFECPRYFNGIDLTKLDLYVNYIRADGGPSSYHIEDVTINPENDKQIHFTWLVGGYLTEVAGNLQFIVSGSKTDESGNVVNKWNTEINSDLYIPKSIESAEHVAALYPDIVTQLLTRLESMPKHNKVCHGDFNPSNVIVGKNGKMTVVDWAHATQGNASADAAMTYLLFALKDQETADLYLKLFCKKSDTARQYVQQWLPIVAAAQLTKDNELEKDFLMKWIDVIDYQ